MAEPHLRIDVLDSIHRVRAAQWDACACPEAADGGRPYDPFTTHRFLAALEDSESVGADSGWVPQHIAAFAEEQLIAVAPFYLKWHSQGEYVFDHAWAQAYEHAGGNYYPKLQGAVPFTPVSGRRFLVHPAYRGKGGAALMAGAVKLARGSGVSSMHVTFCTEDEAKIGQRLGLLHRLGQQFHWDNRGYENFEAFLAQLSARKRKAIRRERSRANAFGGEIKVYTGAEICRHHWRAMWRFYQHTGARKWGMPYLSRAFFDIAHDTLRQDTLLIFANHDGAAVAGAMHMLGRDTLYGRYWGCGAHHDCLHFELCYYRAMEYAIAGGLARIEAGAQGAHKLARGYLPAATHSLHWLAEPAFRRAVAHYLAAERGAVAEEVRLLGAYGPFRKVQIQEHE
ncbi:MAG: N-acetyltransferase [Rhodobacteraceae bacterium]|nr:N-acetyltransferase [Paracoccaceae bacterium]